MDYPRAIESPTATDLADKSIIELAQNVYNNALVAQESADAVSGVADAAQAYADSAGDSAASALDSANSAAASATAADDAATRAEIAAGQAGGGGGFSLINTYDMTFTRNITEQYFYFGEPVSRDVNKNYFLVFTGVLDGRFCQHVVPLFGGSAIPSGTITSANNIIDLPINQVNNIFNINVEFITGSYYIDTIRVYTTSTRPAQTFTINVSLFGGAY